MSGYTHLNSEERDQICALRSVGSSIRSIARALGRSPSTISRELNRNRQESGAYRARSTDGSYLDRRQRPRLPCPDFIKTTIRHAADEISRHFQA